MKTILEKLKGVWAVVATIGALVGWLLFERNKRKSAEALLTNQKSKEEILKIESEKVKANADILAEENKRKYLNEQANKEKSLHTNDTDILNFFRNLK